MPIEILMPALSPTMEEGNVSKWLKQEGDKVSAGDVLAEIETDKATMEVEAVDEGTLGKILISAGTEGVKVNTPIAVLLQDGESAGDLGKAAAPAKAEAPAAAADAKPAEQPAAAPVAAAPKTEVAADPDIPAGTEMVSTTVREALRDAMAEEMRRDPDVFVMGEEVAEYQGAYKVTQDFLTRFKDIDAIWAADDDMAFGAIRAIDQAGRRDIKVIFGGAGAKDMVKTILDGKDPRIQANVSYSPKFIYDAIKLTAEARLKGEKLPATTIIPSVLIDKSNAKDFYHADSPF